MEKPQKLSSLLREIFVERKWGAAFCAFAAYSVLFFLLCVTVLAVLLLPKLYLLLKSQLSLAGFIIGLIAACWFWAAAFASAEVVYWFFKKNRKVFRIAYDASLMMHYILASVFWGGKLPVAVSIILSAAVVALTIVLKLYIKKSKALKSYFGEE